MAEFALVDRGESRVTAAECVPSRAPFWEHIGSDGYAIRLVLSSEADSLLIRKDEHGDVSFESKDADDAVVPLND